MSLSRVWSKKPVTTIVDSPRWFYFSKKKHDAWCRATFFSFTSDLLKRKAEKEEMAINE